MMAKVHGLVPAPKDKGNQVYEFMRMNPNPNHGHNK